MLEESKLQTPLKLQLFRHNLTGNNPKNKLNFREILRKPSHLQEQSLPSNPALHEQDPVVVLQTPLL